MLLNSFQFLFTGWVVAIHLEEMGSGTRTNRSTEEEAEAVVVIGVTSPLGLAAVEEVQPTSNHKVGALVINNNNHSNHKVEEDLDVEEETC